VKAVPAAFDNEAQIVFTSEIDRGRNVARIFGCDCIDARRRYPSIDATAALRSPGLVADEERVAQIAQQLLTSPRRMRSM
jgi:hypothetical protein